MRIPAPNARPAWYMLVWQCMDLMRILADIIECVVEAGKKCDLEKLVEAFKAQALTLWALTRGLVEEPSGGQGTTRPQLNMPGLEHDVPPPEER